ncbi:circularly permuted type 2 ATP-grasp protein [Dasania sp. GY-MA-18]|uniref:Circularly permuted type 2 ATP-grasp protein n=1 Tax=Dasania phycosphaerae TaxID=2950436 RepID=A0A9J6RNU6_9GAMM|nr:MULTISPECIES: circularly permuted type 2 ATP-grasp protein [Dasania]MCR8923423.1 circularly permuted type 2 ATP-grasp protein [Dasania sp. GY-MA-18]MCZ0865856.1 circularly permuted type 2 ATP-grasp protein [Dasania phycosphaerae]MCZ0869580.1 circularly permuted type 2 ATP-grasp protein [Dasania phycosphaerae]
MTIEWKNYQAEKFYDELMIASNKARPCGKKLAKYLASLSNSDLETYRIATELSIKEIGVSFTVYNQEEGSIDRSWPLDIFPRIMTKTEWQKIEAGLKQRVQALNLFIADLYGEQRILKDGIVPKEVFKNSKNFREQCIGVKPPLGIWAHICGSDLVRDKDGVMYVLEDNLRVPSGVSYMLENRLVMKRVFPELFEDYSILPVDDYPSKLFDMLASISPRPADYPEVVVLTPGIYNSAYFEHAYLAQQMGCELVEGRDLVVHDDDCVYMRTMRGLKRVDVIYRRIDDLFLDPEVFNKESTLGVPGLMRAWRKNNVALANAPGAGVADDKVVYAFVPKIIQYYLGEEISLPNVKTYICMYEEDRKYVLANLDKLVVKPANESGGYGMLVGPSSTKKQQKQFAELIKSNPGNYIAQPTLSLSTVPTLVKNKVEPRHVDMRPFILSSDRVEVTTGGLTRVALVKNSLVVNSSQGGGSKDTWIVDEEA